MEKIRPNIRQVEVSEIERFIANIGERPFRVKQIVEWLWQKHAHSCGKPCFTNIRPHNQRAVAPGLCVNTD
jgi:adenine C2-methylase RlmN of 23S rRNA A2503 and tRNA A37